MTVKMFQRLEHRMEKMKGTTQLIQSPRTYKIYRKSKQMNITIAEIKSTLEGTNSSITEAEEQISVQEDKMVEITAEEQNKGIRMKRMRTASETLGTILNAPTFEL